MKIFSLLFAGLTLAQGIAMGQSVSFVDVDAPPGGDGLTWGTAYSDLQDALLAAPFSGVTELWIAEGTYLPTTPGGSQTANFTLVEGVMLYGGFNGSETQLSDRDWTAHESILSGDLLGDDTPNPAWIDPSLADNSQVVVVAVGTSTATGLDGITVRGGSNFPHSPIYYGGGLYIFNGTLTIRNCLFKANNEAWSGGAINVLSAGATLVIESTEFVGNRASGGGAIAAIGTNLTCVDCVFADNGQAGGDGGAIYAYRSTAPSTSIVLEGCTFTGNAVDDNGGALYMVGTDLSIESCAFVGNHANGGGGALHFDTLSTSISQSSFADSTSGGSGGAIFGDGTTSIDGCSFDGSVTLGYGGALFIGDPTTVQNTSFKNGSARRGGAIYADGANFLEDVSFEGNYASEVGGAIYERLTTQIRRGVFLGNSAPYAGAMDAGASRGQSLLMNCRFLGNTATQFGGAIQVSTKSMPLIVNTVIAGNTAVQGAGIYMNPNSIGGQVRIENSTIAENHSSEFGGGVYRKPGLAGTLDLRNTILWGNTSWGNLESSQLDGDLAEVSADYCAVEGWSGAINGEGSWGFDPEFADVLGGDLVVGTLDDDYRLSDTSPYRDAGSNALVIVDSFDLDGDSDLLEPLPMDLDGAPRFHDDLYRLDGIAGNAPEVDLGAYESPGLSPACSSARYCVGGLNSTGSSATIHLHGSLSIAQEALTLRAESCPPNKVGLFLYGPNAGQVPFGDGFLCVTGGIFRLNPPGVSNSAGVIEREIDFNAHPTGVGPGTLTVGPTWNFQLWYRDPQGPGGSGFNTSDAASLVFCP